MTIKRSALTTLGLALDTALGRRRARRRNRPHAFLHHEGVCVACGRPTKAHFNKRNIFVSCNPRG